MRIALYARVSKAEDQTCENQLIQLREWAQKAGIEIDGEYPEAMSSRDLRPVKEELKRRARLGELQGIAFVSLDRWGRDMLELVMDIEDCSKRGIQLISLKEGLRFDTTAGRLYAHLLAAFADFERERIRERTKAGLARVRAQGKKLGRPALSCASCRARRRKCLCGKTPPEKPPALPGEAASREESGVSPSGWRLPCGCGLGNQGELVDPCVQHKEVSL